MSDMVEKEENGSLNLFCSSRCMTVYKAPCVAERGRMICIEEAVKRGMS